MGVMLVLKESVYWSYNMTKTGDLWLPKKGAGSEAGNPCMHTN